MMLSHPEALTADHGVEAFTCGTPVLDAWLTARALSNQEKGFAAVMVVHEAGRVVGYYSSAPITVLPEADGGLPIRLAQLAGPDQPDPETTSLVPCLLLGQLATDIGWTGRGISTGLLAHALRRCVLGAKLTGAPAVVVKAPDGEAEAFWIRRGFLPSKDDPLVLYRTISDIAASLQAARIRVAAWGSALLPLDCSEAS